MCRTIIIVLQIWFDENGAYLGAARRFLPHVHVLVTVRTVPGDMTRTLTLKIFTFTFSPTVRNGHITKVQVARVITKDPAHFC